MPNVSYTHNDSYDEMVDISGQCRPHYLKFKKLLEEIPDEKLREIQQSTERAQLSMGMTFNVYHDNQGTEKILPLDIIPRIMSGKEWQRVEKGLKQRIYALNLFIQDLYNDQKILKDKVIPQEIILSSSNYLKPCEGLTPPREIWCHITGTDIVRDKDGKFFVLEDNLRCPSGVSYLLESREIIKRAFPTLFNKIGVRPVSDYPNKLLHLLQYLTDSSKPVVGLLTPGIYNSAYFEHSYLAQMMGVELVTGQDLVVKNDHVFMKTTQGLQQVDVLYRRIDDTFLDPKTFKQNSMLGAEGLFDAYSAGNIALANAPGTGVADDKAVYAYVPKIIKYYLDEDPIIPNVPTYLCSDEKERQYVLEHLPELVVKETNAAGGYGMMIGPKADKNEHQKFAELIRKNPRNYIAQPTLSLSTVPTLAESNIEPRHVDLRPYILYGEDIEVIPGAFTRVALRKGSLVVNSSQGGGSKDTWILYE
ncbi:circularly permuted type 2 ATP-grasp protein [Rhodohalobacter sp. 614A]|uniref:circularly permuted type 2 ATP-grasp protein n=1 Tax=Rhodohalobacter sp. 614A TaxID=2908649 RepID=UPI001F188B55|nr:circularly permuted type 2 ATP-grasp protein [Rhodohalobacter sp. 614A]